MTIGLALQLFACTTTLAAAWLMGNKHIGGPALNIVAALGFAAVNAWADLWLCAAFSMTMGAINARNFIRWKKEQV
ncbi:hypothetical protein ACRAVF_19250 [Bradyrhizobium oligotrophicum S58]